ncbi:MAG: hypothetical protein ABWX67_00910 [Allosphingosinicella sp.]
MRAYAAEGERLIERAVADPRQTATAIDEREVKARSGRLLAEAKVGEDGSFELDFGRSGYEGGPVDIDLRVETLSHIEERASKAEPRQIHLTTLQPAWREVENDRVAFWEYYMPSRIWCLILSWFDIWVICGRVTICETDKPVSGLTVEARDVDWLQQDYLGSGMTDGNGRFVIYYPGSAFRAGTWANIELFGGPDLYFTIKQGSLVLLAEPPARGRQPDRENVGNCFCVQLCVKETTTHEGVGVFTHVGVYNYSTDVDSAPGGSGLTIADNRAFYQTMRLNGQLPKTINGGEQLEYSFWWREVQANGTPIPGSVWTQVTQSQIARTVIGTLSYYDGSTFPYWFTKVYTVNGTNGPNEVVASFTGDGWIQVPQESNWTMAPGNFSPNGNQINLISTALVPFGPSPAWGTLNMAGKTAGNSSAPYGANRFFSIEMRCRSFPSGPQSVPAGTCSHIAIENRLYNAVSHHPAWAGFVENGALGVNMLDIQELQVQGCAEVDNTLTVLVTSAHPNLGAVTLSIVGGNAGTIGAPPPATLTAPTGGLPDERFGIAGMDFTANDLAPCAYIVTLSTQLLLTTGDTVPSNLVDQMAFCKAPPP